MFNGRYLVHNSHSQSSESISALAEIQTDDFEVGLFRSPQTTPRPYVEIHIRPSSVIRPSGRLRNTAAFQTSVSGEWRTAAGGRTQTSSINPSCMARQLCVATPPVINAVCPSKISQRPHPADALNWHTPFTGCPSCPPAPAPYSRRAAGFCRQLMPCHDPSHDITTLVTYLHIHYKFSYNPPAHSGAREGPRFQ